MAMKEEEIVRLIKHAFPEAEITLKDLVGDKDHYLLEVKSLCFSGKSRIQQHQMVYRALGQCVGGELHALSLKTGVPVEKK